MLIIFEGLDKSGKSTMADMLMQHLQHHMYKAMIIRKSYNELLYPIDYGKASVYDWQAILDRVVLPNSDTIFVADRSFLTQTAYQVCLGTGEHTITDEQMHMFNAYCNVIKTMPHLVVYCMSAKYELDSMVTSLVIKSKLNSLYMTLLQNSKMNILPIDMDKHSFHDCCNIIIDEVIACQNKNAKLI